MASEKQLWKQRGDCLHIERASRRARVFAEMVSLDVINPLKAKVLELGESVRQLKESGGDFKPVLNELLKVKQELSDAVTAYLPAVEAKMQELKAAGGAALEAVLKEVEELKSYVMEDKAAKKKREKEEKKKKQEEEEAAKKAAAAPAEGEQKEGGLSKKEMNKLMKKQKKADSKAAKEEEGTPAAAPAPAAAAPAAKNVPAASAPVAAAQSPSYDLAFPLITTVVCTLTKSTPVKGAVAELKVGDVTLRGDQSVARYIARSSPDTKLYGEDAENTVLAASDIDRWLEFSLTYPMQAPETLVALDEHLAARTFISGQKLSLADIGVWAALVRAFGDAPANQVKEQKNLARWIDTCAATDGFQMACGMYKKHINSGSAGSTGSGAEKKKAKSAENGPTLKVKLPALVGASEGEVITRFPPEPSGHLHIGHVKAIFLNKYYADRYNGKLLVRFDDTNPSKEKVEYEEGIVEDLKHLGIIPYKVSHTSDHFPIIIKYTVKLIEDGNAYMDDTTQEVMSQQRREGEDSARREEKPRDNLVRFFGMLFGSNAGSRCGEFGVTLTPEELQYIQDNTAELLSKWCLRLKIDHATRNKHKGNKALFDPVGFRGNTEPHARTKNEFRAYPTYDLACPIVDSIEGVTHAMRDIQYRDRSPLYAWFFPVLNLREVKIQDFSRMNFVYTLMSKRKLKWFVDTGRVPGWDDPRFPTVKGILRRGMQVDALFQFMVEQGASKNIVDMEWDKFWSLNKSYIDPVAPRYMAVSKESNILVKVFNEDGTPFPSSNKTVPLLPKDTNGEKFGFKSLFLGPEVLVETEDLQGGAPGVDKVVVGEKIVLLNWGVMEVKKIEESSDGIITSIEAVFDPNGDFKKPSKKIHWIVKSPHCVEISMVEFDFLITKPKLEEEDSLDGNIRENSMAVTTLIGEPGLRNSAQDSFLQLLRRGYFRVDKPCRPGTALELFMIPDGKTKAMSTLSTKLAHR